ncbi:MAG: A/G-specific adenine glycosylase [Pseudonocardiales bacterium]|nr:A/G-specific adenine glycosylase [Pseudonocardiales bacterium]
MRSQIAAAVGSWYDLAARDLPWRAPGTSPWAVLVSEIMLQQTPVVRVLPAYAAWLQRWPTPADLAADSPGDAVRMWGKLGYPRRALRLHECAAQIVARHRGAVPSDVTELESLPGIGAYTARAVAVFAFGHRHPVVDTNVRRVIGRAICGRAGAGVPSTARDLRTVEAVLPDDPRAAARTSIALMELGALVCTARTPNCTACPLESACAWLTAGRPVYEGPTVRPQRFAGTDRHVRGLILDVLRAELGPVSRAQLDATWHDAQQRDRAIDSLLADGLLVKRSDGTYTLPT